MPCPLPTGSPGGHFLNLNFQTEKRVFMDIDSWIIGSCLLVALFTWLGFSLWGCPA